MKIPESWEMGTHAPPSVIVHALKKNKRPIGFAPWPEEQEPAKSEKRKRKRKK